MAAVKKVLNVVFACGIRGRLSCSAASIGYRGRIRKRLVHSPVTRLSRNCCQARNYRCGPALGLRPSDADGSCRHVRCCEHSPRICARHALFLPIRAADGRQRDSSGGCCLIRRSARQVARFPVSCPHEDQAMRDQRTDRGNQQDSHAPEPLRRPDKRVADRRQGHGHSASCSTYARRQPVQPACRVGGLEQARVA
jgi:hypothetical protein